MPQIPQQSYVQSIVQRFCNVTYVLSYTWFKSFDICEGTRTQLTRAAWHFPSAFASVSTFVVFFLEKSLDQREIRYTNSVTTEESVL